MSRADRRLRRYIEALVRDRRPRSADAGDDTAAMRLAARLHSAHPGSAGPSTEFVDGLSRALRDAAEAAPAARPRRRQFLRAAALGAATGIGGVLGLGRLRDAAFPASSGAPAPLVPDDAAWVAVAAVADLRAGDVHRFSARGVEGFLLHRDGEVRALSATCTDQGCILTGDAARGRLRCPCHDATFTLDGRPNSGPYADRLSPLPTMRVRTSGAHIEVLLPRPAAGGGAAPLPGA